MENLINISDSPPAVSSSVTTSRSGWRSRLNAMLTMLRWPGPYRVIADFVLFAVVTFTLLRVAMLAVFADHSLLDAVTLIRILWVGFRFDVLVGMCLVFVGTLHVTFIPQGRRLGLLSRCGMEFEWMFAALFLPLMCVVEWLFFDEFQTRLNYIAFEYLVYPTEVCCNLWQSYSVLPMMGTVVSVASAIYFFSRQRLLVLVAAPLAWHKRCGFLLIFLAVGSGLWASISMDSRNVSRDRVAVECAGNGVYSFFYYALTCRLDWQDSYTTIPEADAVERVRRQVVLPSDQLFELSPNPVDRIVAGSRPIRDRNVVLILEESLGSDFVGELGAEGNLTPELDALCQQGLLFDNWYATGNRTARALEAVMTSMPPIPTESILKRDHSEHVFTLAHVLAQRGYERLFMTGGRGLFDGVRSFMTNNGFNHFVEQSDFEDPVFTNAWGVSDEDLFHRGLQELDALHSGGKPFFATLLTVSNHRPFTYPDGRIPDTSQTRDNAVKYADFALGDFFRQAQRHDFYKNTLFVVMGDHGARIYGSQLFPIRSYRVPVLMITPGSASVGSRCSTLACSLDVAPTILGQLGGDYRSVFFGRDVISTPKKDGRAIMQHNHDVTLMTPQGKVVTLGFGKSAWKFELNFDTFKLKPSDTPNAERVNDIAAIFQTAYRLYYADKWFPDVYPTSMLTHH